MATVWNKTILLSGLAVMTMASGAMASDKGDIAALKAQIEALNQKVIAMEEASKAPAPAASATGSAPATAGQPVVGGSFPGSFKLPGSETSVKIGGYLKADMMYDIGTNHKSDYAAFSSIPLDNSVTENREGETRLHARQTRFNLETRTPTELGELKTMMEMDFFNTAVASGAGNERTTNGSTVQLRQAYGQLGNLLIGQTWSNFMDFDAYPTTLDYVGSAGQTFIRQAQVRYAMPITDATTLNLAIENAEADAVLATSTSDVSLDRVPDVTARLQYKQPWGHLALRGVAREITETSLTTNVDDSTMGWGLGFSGKIMTGEKDNLKFQGIYGDGVGRYLFDLSGMAGGASYANGELETKEAYGGFMGYQHYWSPKISSNLLAGYTHVDNNVLASSSTQNEEIASGHVNLIWEPIPQVRAGVEYMHGYRQVDNGTEGELDRVQGSIFYMF